jgi:hypothetical protein
MPVLGGTWIRPVVIAERYWIPNDSSPVADHHSPECGKSLYSFRDDARRAQFWDRCLTVIRPARDPPARADLRSRPRSRVPHRSSADLGPAENPSSCARPMPAPRSSPLTGSPLPGSSSDFHGAPGPSPRPDRLDRFSSHGKSRTPHDTIQTPCRVHRKTPEIGNVLRHRIGSIVGVLQRPTVSSRKAYVVT